MREAVLGELTCIESGNSRRYDQARQRIGDSIDTHLKVQNLGSPVSIAEIQHSLQGSYTLNQWSALCRYSEQGYLAFGNNAAERMVKIPVIGRKNYLFVGSERAGHCAAVLYSLVSSAKANGLEPFAWLRDVFTRLPYHRDSELSSKPPTGNP